jgi:mRNA-degrading endonuclease toxin of MazEF toxin-antitoxin module
MSSRLAGPLRGQVFRANLDDAGPHYWVVVSNNPRNANALDVLTTMITTTPPRSPRPSYVPLADADPFEGWVLCDRIGPIRKDELGPVKGGLSRPTMRMVDLGLAFALGLARPV